MRDKPETEVVQSRPFIPTRRHAGWAAEAG